MSSNSFESGWGGGGGGGGSELEASELVEKDELVKEITSLQEGLKLLVDRVEMVEGESIKLGGNNAMLRTSLFNLVVMRIINIVPLAFIYLLLAFSLYAHLISLTLNHLFLTQHQYYTPLLYSILFIWLWTTSIAALTKAVYVGGGTVHRFTRSKPYDIEQPQIVPDTDHDQDQDDLPLLALLQQHQEGPLARRVAMGHIIPREATTSAGDTLRRFSQTEPSRESDATTTVQVKSNGRSRYCRKCNVYKPDRSHHCSSCNRCVPKMDHCCPWLANACVGHSNYPFFLQFLLSTALLGLFISLTTALELMEFVGTTPGGFELAPLSWTLAMMLGGIFGVCLSAFGGYHLYLSMINRTTIEMMERSSSFIDSGELRSSAREGGVPLSRMQVKDLRRRIGRINVYDLGPKENMKQLFGGWERKWSWIFPIGVPPGDGETFPVNEVKLELLQRLTRELRAGVVTFSSSDSED